VGVGIAYPLVSSKRTIRVMDTALAPWVGLWFVLAVVIGIQMRDLTKLSRTLVASSEVLQQTGIALVIEAQQLNERSRRLYERARTTAFSGPAQDCEEVAEH
jgi:hypothetical protein